MIFYEGTRNTQLVSVGDHNVDPVWVICFYFFLQRC